MSIPDSVYRANNVPLLSKIILYEQKIEVLTGKHSSNDDSLTQDVCQLRSPAFILLHVITHAFHHKGQVVAMLRILGYPAPDTDLQQV